MEWSDVDMGIWWMTALVKISLQALLASALSNLILKLPSKRSVLDQVNGEPTNPKSWNPHKSMARRNRSSCLASLSLPPDFSEWLKISL